MAEIRLSFAQDLLLLSVTTKRLKIFSPYLARFALWLGADVNYQINPKSGYLVRFRFHNWVKDYIMHKSPLHFVAQEGNYPLAKLLVENGATIDSLDDRKYTPLHCAVTKGSLEITKLLIENGANIGALTYNYRDWGETPLHLAAAHGHTHIVEYLLEKGADIEAKMKYGYGRVINLAVYCGHLDTVKLLVERGAKLETSFYAVYHTAHPSYRKDPDFHALCFYTINENVKDRVRLAEFLVEKGFPVEEKDVEMLNRLKPNLGNTLKEIAESKILLGKMESPSPTEKIIEAPPPSPTIMHAEQIIRERKFKEEIDLYYF
jgi:ankyrin repeat protein